MFNMYYTLLLLFVCIAYRSNNFIVGLTNVSPNVSTPTLYNYTVCGQYPGAVPAATAVSLYCQDNLPPFRYVIVQMPRTDYLIICELEVLVIGMRMLNILTLSIICPMSPIITLIPVFKFVTSPS